jgi:hypothetical protein
MRVWACLLVVAAAVFSTPASAERPAVRIGMIPLTDDEQTLQAVALLEQHLLAIEDVTLVERAEILRLLAEHHLVLNMGSDAETWRELSAIVPADVFVLAASRKGEDDRTVVFIRVMESRTGIVLAAAAAQSEELDERMDDAHEQIMLGIAKTTMPADERVYLAFLGITGETGSVHLDRHARMLSAWLEQHLDAEPSITLLERHEIRVLTREEALAGVPLELRSAAVVLRGGMRPDHESDRMVVTLHLQRHDGQDVQQRVAVDMRHSLDAAAEVVELAGKLIGLELEEPDRRSAVEESARLREEAVRRYLRRGEGADQMLLDAIALAEAAYALNPSRENRDLVISYNDNLAAHAHALGRRYYPSPYSAELILDAMNRGWDLRFEQMRERLADGDFRRAYFGGHWPKVRSPRNEGERRINDRSRQIAREYYDLLMPFVADLPPREREMFHSDAFRRISLFAEVPEEYNRRVIMHFDLAYQAYLEDAAIRLEKDDPNVECAPYSIEHLYLPEPIEPHEPLLAYLEAHENPFVNLHALNERMRHDRENALPVAERIMDMLIDPQSRLNRFMSDNPRLSYYSASFFLDAWYNMPTGHNRTGHAEMWQRLRKRLEELEQREAPWVLVRWDEALTERILLAASRTGEDEHREALRAVERILSQLDEMPGDLEEHGPRRHRELLANVQNTLGDPDLGRTPPSPWRLFHQQPRDLEPVASEQAVNVAVALDDRGIDGLTGGSFIVLLRYHQPVRHDGKSLEKFEVHRVSRDLEHSRLVRQVLVPIDEVPRLRNRSIGRETAVAIGNTLVFAADDQGLVVVDHTISIYGEKQGAPSNLASEMAIMSGRVFAVFPNAFAEFDTVTRRFRLIASSGAVERRSALDGALFHIYSMTRDMADNALWISTRDSGTWRFDLDDDHLSRVMNVRGFTRSARLIWIGDRLVAATDRPDYEWERSMLEIDRQTLIWRKLPYDSDEQRLLRLVDPKDMVRIGDQLISGNRIVTTDAQIHHAPHALEMALSNLYAIDGGFVALQRTLHGYNFIQLTRPDE